MAVYSLCDQLELLNRQREGVAMVDMVKALLLSYLGH